MKASYKIALAVAAGITVLIVIYYTSQDGGESSDTPGDTITQLTDTTPPRPTLREDLPPTPRSQLAAPSAPPGATSSAAAPKPPAANQSDLMARIRQQYAATQETTEPAPQTPSPADPPADSTTSQAPAPSSPATLTTATDTPAPSVVGPVAAEHSQTPAPLTPTAPAIATTTATKPEPVTPRPASTNAKAVPSTYTVVAGDNLSRIAAKVYGDERFWVDIAQANPLADPTRLKIGQQLRMPAAGDLRSAPDAVEAPGDARTYTVRAGDTLSTIAEMHYGSSDGWRVIYNANRDLIGANPDRIKAGSKLVIPPALPNAR